MYFFYFSMETYIVGTHWNRLCEAIPKRTHNECSYGEIRIFLIFLLKYKSFNLEPCSEINQQLMDEYCQLQVCLNNEMNHLILVYQPYQV